MKATQNSRILSALLKGQRLTPIKALKKFGTFRLAARCWELANKPPYWNVNSEIVTVGKKRVAQYFIP